jgi:hypothetical protein
VTLLLVNHTRLERSTPHVTHAGMLADAPLMDALLQWITHADTLELVETPNARFELLLMHYVEVSK